MKKLACIGTGNMGGSLARAACQSPACGPDEVILSNRTYEKAKRLAEELGCRAAESNLEAFREAEYILLGVKPQMMEGLLRELAPAVKESMEKGERKVLVTMAAGLKISFYREVLGCEEIPVIRLMPNTPAAVGCGMTLVCTSCPDEDTSELESLLSASGAFDRIPEEQMDAAGTLTGCTPAFAYMFMEALADGGVMAGIPRKKAQEYAARAVMGAAALLLESGKHPGLLKDEVCSPGGSTIVGVYELEKKGFRSAAMEAVLGACEKNKKMGEGKK